MPRSMHVHIDLPSALRNWNPSQWDCVATNEQGHILSADDLKAVFEAEVAQGTQVYPCCPRADCPGFDYSGGGCPGHEEP